MATSPHPHGIRLTEQDRERLDYLAVFWGTDNVTALLRMALEHEYFRVMAWRGGPAPFEWENNRRRTAMEEQYEKRMAELRRMAAELVDDDSPLVPAAR